MYNENEEILAKEIIANNFNRILENSGKSIYRVSKDTGIAHSFLYEIRNPKKNKKPSIETLIKLAKYFEVELQEFYKTN